MQKKQAGRDFERAVRDVVQALDPGAVARDGEWVRGPDGRRDMDVFVEGTADGQSRSVLIECKDFDPKRTGPVGIDRVDALDSKRRDLGVDVALICSNAGFTENAKRKAKRVGIGLIGVMRKGDTRIRVFVEEDMYVRQITVTRLVIELRRSGQSINLTGVPFEAVLWEGKPVGKWVTSRVALMLGANQVVSGSYTGTHHLNEPLSLDVPSGSVEVDEINFETTISGQWTVQRVALDASNGLYDWLRNRIRLRSGEFQVHDLRFDGGRPISKPPDYVIDLGELRNGEVVMRFCSIAGLGDPDPVPDLSRFVQGEDLAFEMDDLPLEAFISSPDYVHGARGEFFAANSSGEAEIF